MIIINGDYIIINVHETVGSVYANQVKFPPTAEKNIPLFDIEYFIY